MELDDFKNAWQTLDRRLQQQNALNFELLRSHRADAMRRGLRPLVIGQAIGMLVGVAAMFALLPLWTHPAPTHDLAVKICGIGLHVYCIALIVFGGIMQGLARGRRKRSPVPAVTTSNASPCAIRLGDATHRLGAAASGGKAGWQDRRPGAVLSEIALAGRIRVRPRLGRCL